jgi:hypothetical protein
MRNRALVVIMTLMTCTYAPQSVALANSNVSDAQHEDLCSGLIRGLPGAPMVFAPPAWTGTWIHTYDAPPLAAGLVMAPEPSDGVQPLVYFTYRPASDEVYGTRITATVTQDGFMWETPGIDSELGQFRFTPNRPFTSAQELFRTRASIKGERLQPVPDNQGNIVLTAIATIELYPCDIRPGPLAGAGIPPIPLQVDLARLCPLWPVC